MITKALGKLVKTVFWPVDLLLRYIAISLVIFYRKLISRHKGFRCAYNASTGKGSCSDIALVELKTKNLFSAITGVREQFRRCRNASFAVKADVFDRANADLDRAGVIAAAGVIGCCGGGGGGGGGPLGMEEGVKQEQSVVMVDTTTENWADDNAML